MTKLRRVKEAARHLIAPIILLREVRKEMTRRNLTPNSRYEDLVVVTARRINFINALKDLGLVPIGEVCCYPYRVLWKGSATFNLVTDEVVAQATATAQSMTDEFYRQLSTTPQASS
jgi:hypothetical protein